MVEHTTRAFDLELQELARKIVDMGRSDDEQIANATEALLKRDTALARRVIAADDLIDAQQRDIEEKTIAVIARRQPMAVDLREIVGALRISNDLERVGESCRKYRQASAAPDGGVSHRGSYVSAGAHGAACARPTKTGAAKL